MMNPSGVLLKTGRTIVVVFPAFALISVMLKSFFKTVTTLPEGLSHRISYPPADDKISQSLPGSGNGLRNANADQRAKKPVVISCMPVYKSFKSFSTSLGGGKSDL